MKLPYGIIAFFVQRTGLGRALIERLTAKLVQDGIPTITLVCVVKYSLFASV
jgi:predicted N-acetyltransferase YhbS